MLAFALPRSGRLSGSEALRSLVEATLALALVAALLAGFAGLVSALYLVKSWLGINLMAGPSPLHGVLYHLVR